MCFFSFVLSFFSIFSRSNAHTHTNKRVRRFAETAERRQRAVLFTRFLDHIYCKLIFDSFSLKYDMIRSPYVVKIRTFNERSFSCQSVTIKSELQHTALPCWLSQQQGTGKTVAPSNWRVTQYPIEQTINGVHIKIGLQNIFQFLPRINSIPLENYPQITF